MRDYAKFCPNSFASGPGVLASEAPPTWTDLNGVERPTPQIIGRLKPGKVRSHRALRELVVARDGSCRWCGATVDLIADHIISRRNGGAHHPLNFQALCQRCNSRKVGLVDAVTR